MMPSYRMKDQLYLSLTKTLTGSQVETSALVKALELICNSTALQCGLVYEVNPSGDFNLSGYYASSPSAHPACIDAETFTPQERLLMIQQNLCRITKAPDNTALQQKLLQLFCTKALIMTPVSDEEHHLYGMVVLIGSDGDADIANLNMDDLSVALLLLVRYIAIRMYQSKLNQAQLTMGSILDNTGIDIYVNDFENHDILYVNKSMAAPYGGQAQFWGHKCWQVLFPGQSGPCEFCPQNKLIDDNGLPTKVYTWDYQRAFDGSWFRVFSGAFRWVDGRLAHVVSSADITDNKRNEALVENLANYDQLTKLPNRRMLVNECDRRINNSSEGEQGYVLFFDIDGFKAINDTYGHDAGDEFLVQLGEFFSGIPLLKDSIYRNGGDEFVALIDGNGIYHDTIKSLAYFIQSRFRKPWVLKKGEVLCSTSVGVACYPEDGTTSELLLQKADMAMYRAKRAGGGSVCFSSQMSDPLSIL